MKVVVFGATGSTGRLKLALKEVMSRQGVAGGRCSAEWLDWTIVRPATLTFKQARGNLKDGTDLRWNVTSTATRADVAEYMVKILDGPTTFRKAITVRN